MHLTLRIEETLVYPTYGFGGAYILIALYCRQQYKREPIFSFFPGITYHNLPVITFTTQLIFWLCGLTPFVTDIKFTFLAILVGWSYLRFYYKYDDVTDHLGDYCDEFCFVAMFPHALRPIIVPFSTAFYNLFVLVGLFPEGVELQSEKVRKSNLGAHHLRYHNPESGDSADSSQSHGGGGVEDPSSTRTNHPNSHPHPLAALSDAKRDRQRAKAMKLLDARFAELSNKEKDLESWDDKNDGDDGNDASSPHSSSGDLSANGQPPASSSSSSASTLSTLFTRQASSDVNSSLKV